MHQTELQPVGRLAGAIEFEHVSFAYNDTEPVLEDFELKIRAHETVALVGHTGAGKSSIAKLIARFYEFQGGRILVDGRDIRTFSLRDYRRQLGIVSQVPFLFSGTVADNIRYGAQGVSDAEIGRMASQIGEGEWLETLPQGLKTEVGERGARLSMGQRQLVSLMRVLVQQPAIFVLDEATASIDPFTEWQIQRALDLILAKSTSILIAHRLSTVKSADRIIVMRTGKIIEEGSHASLLAAGRALRRAVQHLLPASKPGLRGAGQGFCRDRSSLFSTNRIDTTTGCGDIDPVLDDRAAIWRARIQLNPPERGIRSNPVRHALRGRNARFILERGNAADIAGIVAIDPHDAGERSPVGGIERLQQVPARI